MEKAVRRSFYWFLLCLGLSAGIAAHGQNPLDRVITLDQGDVTAEELLESVQKQGDFLLSYNAGLISSKHVVSGDYQAVPAQQILTDVFGTQVEFVHRGRYVIVRESREAAASKEEVRLQGTVRNAKTGEVLSDVSVYDARNLDATLSDGSGGYDLKVQAEDEYIDLMVSRSYFRDTLVRVPKSNDIQLDLALSPDSSATNGWFKSRVDSLFLVKLLVPFQSLKHMQNIQLSEDRSWQVSFLPFLGTNGRLSGEVTNKYSFNVVAGYAKGLDGVEFGGFANINREEATGAQFAGATNITGGRFAGAQFAGVCNVNIGKTEAAQFAGVCNVAADTLAGFQAAGFANISAKRTHGTQISGFFNYARGLRGVQIGIINVADTIESGLAIGLFSYVKSGFHVFELGHHDVLTGRAQYKTGSNGFYNIFSLGYRYDSQHPLWSYGYGFGTQKYAGKRFFVGAELLAHSMHPFDRWLDEINMLNQLNLNLGFNFSKRLAITAGPVLNNYVSRMQHPELENIGFEVMQSPFYDKTTNGTRVAFWVGYQVGIRF